MCSIENDEKKSMSEGQRVGNRREWGLALGALGVVYGDIGTSPLYALRECFHGPHAAAPTPENILGVLSLVFWSLVLIVSVKYLGFILRADNRGEGGILALLSLVLPERSRRGGISGCGWLMAVGVFGAALLYGDGIITPAITVLGAVEGIRYVTPVFEPFILPITVGLLVALFAVQRAGTGGLGYAFGPLMLLWFIALGLLGANALWREPMALAAANPWHAIRFFARHGFQGFIVLGAVVLVITGSEALYADLGHFGRRPIRRAWFIVALPALLLNYFGQGALLLRNPAAADHPFYRMAPPWALYPMVILATVAAIVASQALISGSFSLTMQAIQLGYLPRLEIDHTSSHQRGQIYLPLVNFTLMLLCIGLVLGFKSSNNLAAAYGVAVTLTMMLTTILFFFMSRRVWHWSSFRAGLFCGVALWVEASFLGANLVKIGQGGWFPLLVALAFYSLMSTWHKGRQILGEKLSETALPMKLFLEEMKHHPPHRVHGTAVYMSGRSKGTPIALLHNLKHNKVLHERIILLNITTSEVPHADPEHRVEIEKLKEGVYRVSGQYGFMEDPNVPELLAQCSKLGLVLKLQEVTYFLSSETIIPRGSAKISFWRAKLFAFLSRNAQRATIFFQLPANRVVELGMQIEL